MEDDFLGKKMADVWKGIEMAGPFYAHTKDNEPPDRWQPLEDYSKNVGKLAPLLR